MPCFFWKVLVIFLLNLEPPNIIDMFVKYAQSKWLGILIVLISAITYSLKAIFVKLAYRYQTDPITLLSLRMLFSAPFFAAIIIFDKRKPFVPSLSDFVGITVMGILGFYLSSLFDFIGLQYISAALERMILFIYPTIVLFLGAFISRKAIRLHQLLAVALTYTGLVVVFWAELHLDQKNLLRGSMFVFAAAMTFAFYYVGSEKLIPRFGSLRYTAYTLLVTTIFVLLHSSVVGAPFTSVHPDVLVLAALLAIISTVIPTLLLSIGIGMVGASTSATVSTIGPISTILLANIILGERLHFYQCIGACIVVAGIVLLGRKKAVLSLEQIE